MNGGALANGVANGVAIEGAMIQVTARTRVVDRK
jgi:hypothetical protein